MKVLGSDDMLLSVEIMRLRSAGFVKVQWLGNRGALSGGWKQQTRAVLGITGS